MTPDTRADEYRAVVSSELAHCASSLSAAMDDGRIMASTGWEHRCIVLRHVQIQFDAIDRKHEGQADG